MRSRTLTAPASSSAVRAPSAGAVALAGLSSLAVAMGIGRFAFTPILPMMQADVGLSVAAGGLLASANYGGYLLGSVSAIWMRLAAPTAIRAGLLAIGVATLAMGVLQTFTAWAVLRGLAGFASAWVLIFVSAWCLERLGPAQRPTLASTVYAGVGTGIAVAGATCLFLMQRQGSASAAWIVLGVLSLGVAILVSPTFGAPNSRKAEQLGDEGGRRWDAETLRLIICYGAWGFGYIIPATFIPAMAREIVRDPAVFGWSWPIFGAASIAGMFIAGRCSRFMSNRRIWALSQATMAVGVLLPVVWPGIGAILCAALFVGGTFMVTTMTGMQEARRIHAAGAKRLMAAMTAAFAVGQIGGPVLVSALTKRGDAFREGLLVASLVLFISAFALRDSRVGRRRSNGHFGLPIDASHPRHRADRVDVEYWRSLSG